MADQVPLEPQYQERQEEDATDSTAFNNHQGASDHADTVKSNQPYVIPDQTASEIPPKEKEDEEATVTTAFINNHANDVNNVDRKLSRKSDHTLELPLEEDRDDWDDDVNEVNEYDGSKYNVVARGIFLCQRMVLAALKISKERHLLTIFFALAYAAYFVAAMIYKFGDDGSIRLLVCTAFGVLVCFQSYLAKGCKFLYVKTVGNSGVDPKVIFWGMLVFRWVSYIGMVVFAGWVIFDNADDTDSWRSLPGLLGFVVVCVLFSSNPKKIDWHIVFWGLGLQFLFAVCTLKYKFGQDGIQYIQDRLDEFFANSKDSSKLLFGPETHQHMLLLEALPIGFMIGATTSILYYTGAMQFFIKWVGGLFMVIFGTQAAESMAVSGGIFLDWTSSILALRPWLDLQSKSQMFIIITSVFASLGGAYVAILVQFHVPLSHILPAMVISAPATFAVCKLIVPETRPKDSARNQLNAVHDTEKPQNIMEAFQAGALMFLPLLGNVIATGFAFLCGINWLNSTFEWFGDRIGVDGFTMEYMFSYILYPLAYAMGVHPDECKLVARLLGVRFLSSNFVAFLNMMPLVGNRYMYNAYMAATNNSGPVLHDGDDMFLVYFNKTLPGGMISERSQLITTFSLCGFSSIVTMAFTIAAFYTLVPKRRQWITKMAIPALVAGNIANCMTACFASLFY